MAISRKVVELLIRKDVTPFNFSHFFILTTPSIVYPSTCQAELVEAQDDNVRLSTSAGSVQALSKPSYDDEAISWQMADRKRDVEGKRVDVGGWQGAKDKQSKPPNLSQFCTPTISCMVQPMT